MCVSTNNVFVRAGENVGHAGEIARVIGVAVNNSRAYLEILFTGLQLDLVSVSIDSKDYSFIEKDGKIFIQYGNNTNEVIGVAMNANMPYFRVVDGGIGYIQITGLNPSYKFISQKVV